MEEELMDFALNVSKW